MKKEVLFNIKSWFDNYMNNFTMPDQEHQKQIVLKYNHSTQVYHEINNLATSLELSSEEKNLANTIGLLHDVGRFEQYKRYHTFSDPESLDHAKLGNDIIKNNNLLESITPQEKDIIFKAIFYHNKALLQANESRQILKFSKMIRDADKLDIYKIFVERYHEPNEGKKTGSHLSYEPTVTTEVYQQIMKRKMVSYKKLQTIEDLKLMQLGWIYDINFNWTFKEIKERGYLDKIYQTMVKSQETERAYEIINNYLEEKLKINIYKV